MDAKLVFRSPVLHQTSSLFWAKKNRIIDYQWYRIFLTSRLKNSRVLVTSLLPSSRTVRNFRTVATLFNSPDWKIYFRCSLILALLESNSSTILRLCKPHGIILNPYIKGESVFRLIKYNLNRVIRFHHKFTHKFWYSGSFLPKFRFRFHLNSCIRFQFWRRGLFRNRNPPRQWGGLSCLSVILGSLGQLPLY